MTRKKKFQKGCISLHYGSWSLRIQELDHTSGKWTTRRIMLGKFKDEEAARKAADSIIVEVNERNNNEPKELNAELTFKEFIDTHWKLYRKTAKHQSSTIENHDSLIKNHLMPFLKDKELKEVQPSDISKLLQLKTDEDKLSNNTMQNLYGLLRLMFDIAAQFDLIDKSPVRPKLHKPEMEKVKKPTLSAIEIRAILQLLPNEQERVFALLLAVTGMRIGEALALRWMDFNATKSELSINHTLFRQKLKKPKTESSIDTLKLDPRIAALLLCQKKKSSYQAKDDFIFCRPDGRPLNPSALRNHLYDVLDGLEIERASGKFGYHIFRHSAGTLLYARSRDLKLVQGTLRHADISTTSDIYVHLDDVVLGEGSMMLTDEILGIRDRAVTEESQMVS